MRVHTIDTIKLEWIQLTKRNLSSSSELFKSLGEVYVNAFLRINELIWKETQPQKLIELLNDGSTMQDFLEENWECKVLQLTHDLPKSNLVKNGCFLATIKSGNGNIVGWALLFVAPIMKIISEALASGNQIKSVVQLLIDDKAKNFWGDEAYLSILVVSPNSQQKGFGRKLAFSVFDKCPRIKKLYLITSDADANDKAQQFYEHLGFIQQEIINHGLNDQQRLYCYLLD